MLRAPHLRLLRRSALASGVAAVVVAVPATASATPPEYGTFSSHKVFVDAEVCAPEGFAVDVIEDEAGWYRLFFDNTGAVTSIAVHTDYRAVITANGHTIVERDTWTDTYEPDGTLRRVGDSVHIQGPGPGLVQHDAGQIVFDPDGSIASVHGPHPQAEGQTFCFALQP